MPTLHNQATVRFVFPSIIAFNLKILPNPLLHAPTNDVILRLHGSLAPAITKLHRNYNKNWLNQMTFDSKACIYEKDYWRDAEPVYDRMEELLPNAF